VIVCAPLTAGSVVRSDAARVQLMAR